LYAGLHYTTRVYRIHDKKLQIRLNLPLLYIAVSLNTDAGTGTLADGIFRAFLTYKREQEIRLNGSSQTILPEDLPQPEEKTPAPADFLNQPKTTNLNEP
jgi:hypothetical protein